MIELAWAPEAPAEMWISSFLHPQSFESFYAAFSYARQLALANNCSKQPLA